MMNVETEVIFLINVHQNYVTSIGDKTKVQKAFCDTVTNMTSTRQLSETARDVVGRIYGYTSLKAPAEVRYEYKSSSDRC